MTKKSQARLSRDRQQAAMSNEDYLKSVIEQQKHGIAQLTKQLENLMIHNVEQHKTIVELKKGQPPTWPFPPNTTVTEHHEGYSVTVSPPQWDDVGEIDENAIVMVEVDEIDDGFPVNPR